MPRGTEDLPRLRYAQQVFKEALRLYPPVPVYEREVLEPITIGGYPLPTQQALVRSPDPVADFEAFAALAYLLDRAGHVTRATGRSRYDS